MARDHTRRPAPRGIWELGGTRAWAQHRTVDERAPAASLTSPCGVGEPKGPEPTREREDGAPTCPTSLVRWAGASLPPPLPFVFLQDSGFYFPPWRLGDRTGALGAWHGTRDPGGRGTVAARPGAAGGPASPTRPVVQSLGFRFKSHLRPCGITSCASVPSSVKGCGMVVPSQATGTHV